MLAGISLYGREQKQQYAYKYLINSHKQDNKKSANWKAEMLEHGTKGNIMQSDGCCLYKQKHLLIKTKKRRTTQDK